MELSRLVNESIDPGRGLAIMGHEPSVTSTVVTKTTMW